MIHIHTKRVRKIWYCYATISGYDHSFNGNSQDSAQQQMRELLSRKKISGELWHPCEEFDEEIVLQKSKFVRPKLTIAHLLNPSPISTTQAGNINAKTNYFDMKVICIEGAKEGNRGIVFGVLLDKANEVYEGEVYVVTESGEEYGIKYYRLHGKIARYKQSRFIPLSGIDETELVNQIAETY